MRGAVAAGHPLSAAAGARVLAEGGNAVDAAIAAGFASWVVESPLTGPGGGGFMLVHRARDRTTRLFDFFVAVPGLGRPRRAAEMESVQVDFDLETAQAFNIGSASCAVPGTPAGLETVHRAYGTLPWAELIVPAVELARGGFELTRQQAYLHAILDVILRHTPEGRRVYRRRKAGERLRPRLRDRALDLARPQVGLDDRAVRGVVVDHERAQAGRQGRAGAPRGPRPRPAFSPRSTSRPIRPCACPAAAVRGA